MKFTWTAASCYSHLSFPRRLVCCSAFYRPGGSHRLIRNTRFVPAAAHLPKQPMGPMSAIFLVGFEVGLSAVLQIVAGLLMTSFVRLMRVNKGFNHEHGRTEFAGRPLRRIPAT
ncbi:MAG: hypothetical protein DMG57_05955 [Acidobacteria bacterium]|nr:MAG: hypothetical protein DMG57_05955 [Acidobacteriota bacterium]